MAGLGTAVKSGQELEARVIALGERLGLDARRQVRVGKRLWGAERVIDVILGHTNGKRLGVECKYQGTTGSAEEKIPATIQDLAAWPISGIVAFDGDGFSERMRFYLLSTGKAVELEDLEDWLRLYFGLPLAEEMTTAQAKLL